jgi:hypothetical protein
MATRSHTTFKKRQKELARLDRQRDKVAKRAERKLEKQPLSEADMADASYINALKGIDDVSTEETDIVEAPPTNS